MDCSKDIDVDHLGFWYDGYTIDQLANGERNHTLPFCIDDGDCIRYTREFDPDAIFSAGKSIRLVCAIGFLAQEVPSRLVNGSDATTDPGCGETVTVQGICVCNPYQSLGGPRCEKTWDAYYTLQLIISFFSLCFSIWIMYEVVHLIKTSKPPFTQMSRKKQLTLIIGMGTFTGYVLSHVYIFVEWGSPVSREEYYLLVHSIEAVSTGVMTFSFTFNNMFTAGQIIEILSKNFYRSVKSAKTLNKSRMDRVAALFKSARLLTWVACAFGLGLFVNFYILQRNPVFMVFFMQLQLFGFAVLYWYGGTLVRKAILRTFSTIGTQISTRKPQQPIDKIQASTSAGQSYTRDRLFQFLDSMSKLTVRIGLIFSGTLAFVMIGATFSRPSAQVAVSYVSRVPMVFAQYLLLKFLVTSGGTHSEAIEGPTESNIESSEVGTLGHGLRTENLRSTEKEDSDKHSSEHARGSKVVDASYSSSNIPTSSIP